MSNLYGFFGDKVYRMSTKTKVEPKVINPFQSSTYVKENTSERSLTSCIRINTMDFYKEEPNEVLYAKILNYLAQTGINYINTLYFSFKVALDYQITDTNGVILDAGIRYIETDADEVNVLLDPDPITNMLPYRKAEYLKKKFAITRINGSTYGVMDPIPRGIYFKINSVKIYANLTDSGSEYYIRNLGISGQNTTFAYNSGTVNSITKHSVVLLDTEYYGITIPVQKLNYLPNTIFVSVEALINQFCAVADDTEIWRVIQNNGGTESDAPSEFEDFNGCCSPFDPIVNRPPCPGNRPMPPFMKPGIKPGCGCKPPISSGDTPIKPGDCWNPNCPMIPDDETQNPDENPDNKPDDGNQGSTGGDNTGGNEGTGGDNTGGDNTGDSGNELPDDMAYEWVICPEYEWDITPDKFLVVADDIADEDFEATTMVKYSDVVSEVTDVKVGNYVKQSLVIHW